MQPFLHTLNHYDYEHILVAIQITAKNIFGSIPEIQAQSDKRYIDK